MEGKRDMVKLDVAALILFLFNLIFCSTRASWMGFALGVVVVCFIRYRKKVVYFLLGIAAVFVIQGVRNRIFDMFNIKERLSLWKTGLYMFRDNFFTGVGNGNYIFRYGEYIKRYKELDLGRLQFSVHNSYIKMFAELGIFGGIFFTVMYVSLFNLVLRAYRYSRKYELHALAFIGFAVAYLFQNFFNNLVFIPQLNVFVWIVGALLYKGLYLESQGD
jgi:O-antigen ligase